MMQDLFILFSPRNVIFFILVLTRLSGMLITAPFFSTYPIPMQAKAGLVALSAFIMYPLLIHAHPFTVPQDVPVLTIYLLKELFVGILIGFCTNLIFVGIQMAGHLISMQMGISMSEVLDPMTRQQTPVLGQVYMFLASLVFIFINGHQWLFSSVYNSYSVIPVGLDFHLSGALVERIILFTSQMFIIAFQVVIPIYGVLLIADIALGFLSKMMPQMNVFMVAIPFKIYVGIILMIAFMTTTGIYMSNLMQSLLESINHMFV